MELNYKPYLLSALLLMLIGWGGLYLLVMYMPPFVWARWGFFVLMLMAVAERTREIGIRKAIGATTENVFTQVLVAAFPMTRPLMATSSAARRCGLAYMPPHWPGCN